MSYSTRIKKLESQIKKLEDSLKPRLKPVFYTVFNEGGKIKLPDGKEVTTSELSHLQMQGLYREYKIIQVRFVGDDKYKHAYAIQETTLKAEPQESLLESQSNTDTPKLIQTSKNDTNPPNEPITPASSPLSPIQHKKRPTDTSPLVELFK